MNETSIVTMSKARASGGSSVRASACRALTRSMTTTRGSVRSFQSSWPWPTSSATTRRAPRCSSTSVNPPVEAPMSSASRAGDVDAEGVERVRELEAAAADLRMIGDGRASRRRRRRRCVPAFATGWPLTRTCPARISARARSRDAARPRSTSSDVEPECAFFNACGRRPSRAMRRQLSAEAGARRARRARGRRTRPRAAATRRGRRAPG